ncbi:MAG: NfeD family protein [Oscillospiraceae bacterium]|nr:NfeD family protein [Oscillospiraceae bacterium]
MEWFYPVLWLVLIILFVVVEASTVQLVSIWLAVGSLAALIPAMMGASPVVQVVVFVAVSAVCLFCTRPFVKKVLSVKKVSTNADRTVGEVGLVTETIDNTLESGRIMVDGLSWKAKAADGTVLEAGTRVRVKAIQGVTLTVEQAD